MLKCVLFIAFILSISFSQGQVANNQINQRFQLQLDADPTSSTTSNSTVEWQCINKALTNKCLVYHNDQWFSFQVEKGGNYYLNLSSQQCKKSQGLQVILIEGNPCEIKTYSILQCISKVSQEDTFVELPNVKAGVLYLVNIDGFLGDFCEFGIQLSSHLSGLPLRFSHTDSVKAKSYLNDRKVYLTWKASPEFIGSIENFRVGRKTDGAIKNKWMNVDLKLNAYGQPETDYSLTDTLNREGSYTYTILGVKKESGYPVFLHEEKISYYEKSRSELPQNYVYVSPGFEKSGTIEVLILNGFTESVIGNSSQSFNPKSNQKIGIYVGSFATQGVKSFDVQIKHLKTREVKRFSFRINEQKKFELYSKGQ